MTVIINPFHCEGTIASIPSKSFAHRALICAALAQGPSRIALEKSSVDIDATRDAMMALGASIRQERGALRIGQLEKKAAAPLVDAVESGSTLRFLLPVAAALYPEVHFTGRGRLPQRPIGALLTALAANGANASAAALPLTIQGPLTGLRYALPGDISSQFVSGILMAAPLLKGEVEILLTSPLESRDYVSITLDVMKSFGVVVEETAGTEQGRGGYLVPAGQSYRGTEYAVEGDWSNAAFFLVAGALSGPIRMTGLKPDSVQGDRGILKVLADFGAEVETGAGEGIRVSPGQRRPFQVDLSRMPDSLPILAILAAACPGGVSRFVNGSRLRLKESDRLQSVARMIRDLGGEAEELPDGLNVLGTGGLQGGTTSSFGDHRLAMAAAIAAVIAREPVTIQEPRAVEKSYPAFFQDLQMLGGTADDL